MKFFESHFDDYIKSYELDPLHNINFLKLSNFNNFILYGPDGIGKYTQSLLLIKQHSSSNLKYEKKFELTYNKNIYYFKISDIHYEVDMSLLGCNAKLLWHEIYCQISDIISSKNIKKGFILCKNFNEIDNELLEIFFSYMQSQYNSFIDIKFIIITKDISFIPDNILNYCFHINISKPSRTSYNKIFKNKLSINDFNNITNIKSIKNNNSLLSNKNINNKYNNSIIQNYKPLCDNILQIIINTNNIKYCNLRELLYDICIYDFNILLCIWYILGELIHKKIIDNIKLDNILIETFDFIKLYNNNYRPIYHLEKYIISIIIIIHDIK